MPDRTSELELAARAVRMAARATVAVRAAMAQDGAGTAHKTDRSPVTVADYAAQAVVAHVLAEALPMDLLVGEEDAGLLRGDASAPLRARVTAAVAGAMATTVSEAEVLSWLDRGTARGDGHRHWVLDPVDGTKGFLRGGQYAIALALVEDGEVVVAALGCPAYAGDAHGSPGLLQLATRGGGAFECALGDDAATRRPLARTAPAGRALRFCESVEAGHSDQRCSAAIAQQLAIDAPPLRMDSQAKYAAVARGDADLYLRLPTRADYREKIWDHAAGMLVLHESGGEVTDVDGKALDFRHGRTLLHNRGVLASRGFEHARLVAAVQRALDA